MQAFRAGMNHVYIVTDNNKYVLRVYTNWRTKKEVTEEVRLLIHLNKNKTPVSFPIDNLNEYIQELNAPEGLRYAVLFRLQEISKRPS
jgi:Ser/Thr protein kinase RdoA (MazF antagonist)